MRRIVNTLLLVLPILVVSACSDGSSSVVDDGINGEDGGDSGTVDDGVNPGDLSNPEPVTADTAVFLDLPYRQALSELDDIVTGDIHPGGASFSDYFEFAVSPAWIDELMANDVSDCSGGGTVEYLYAADGSGNESGGVLFTEQTFRYANCVTNAGFVNGTIVIRQDEVTSGTDSERRASTSFTIEFSQPEAEGTLNGVLVIEQRSTFLFIPVCGSTESNERTVSLTLENSSVVNIADSETTHYYATLDHAQTDETELICEDGVESSEESSRYASAATYTKTSADEVIAYQIDKTGEVNTATAESDEINDLARFVARVDIQDMPTQVMTITATSPAGEAWNVVIQQGESSVQFTDEQNFRELTESALRIY
ncbi:hypothetical protein ACUNV4_23060 [Granulosicoccus sp. 3-233]|uniref:hypothetical protein n=1 Tax=Granulosicoccus sp. 3-233 TaxID=3417969 RepID=UPI003D330047